MLDASKMTTPCSLTSIQHLATVIIFSCIFHLLKPRTSQLADLESPNISLADDSSPLPPQDEIRASHRNESPNRQPSMSRSKSASWHPLSVPEGGWSRSPVFFLSFLHKHGESTQHPP